MVLLTILEIAIGLVAALISRWFFIYFKYRKYLKHFPGPRQLPIIGSMWVLKDRSQFLLTSFKLQQKYGTIVKMQMGFQPPSLVIGDYKALEHILSSQKILEKSDDYRYFHEWLGTGLLTSHGEKWKKYRRLLTPAFHFQNLEQFADIFSTYSNIMVEKLRAEVGKSCVNIYPYVNLCSLDIICASAMGTVVDAQRNSTSEYVQSVQQTCKLIIDKITSVAKSQYLLYLFTNDYWSEKRALKILHGYTQSVISARKNTLLNDEKRGDLDAAKDIESKKKKTFLDILLLNKLDGRDISDEDIRQQVDTFMFEGHDTTTSAISFTLHCIANHPDVQENVVDELRSIFYDHKDRCATYRDLQKMKYLEMVIKESLRLYPSVPLIGRRLHEDVVYDGHVIPKGVTLSLFSFGVHRCPEVYPDPDRFDPERFSPENQSQRSPYAYIPFSAGPRNCIGQRFAMLEMKSVVSSVLRNFELSPCAQQHQLKLVGEIILKSSTGVCIRLKDRKLCSS